jgi:hypothetical protein
MKFSSLGMESAPFLQGAWRGSLSVASPVFNEARIYRIPNSFKMMRMTTMTSKTWTALPVRGKPEKTFGPKNPSSQSITRITMIVHNMRFLLLSDSLSMMGMDGGLSDAHPLQVLALIDPYTCMGPELIVQ